MLYMILIALVYLPHQKILDPLILISLLSKPNDLLLLRTLTPCHLLLVLNFYYLKFTLSLILWTLSLLPVLDLYISMTLYFHTILSPAKDKYLILYHQSHDRNIS